MPLSDVAADSTRSLLSELSAMVQIKLPQTTVPTLAECHLHVFFFERNSSCTVCFNGPSYLVRVAVSLEDLSRLFVHRSQKVS
ncbi:hypothetical protein FOZ60_007513 [Perkinsus olseni]|uniref:Uncharacterized protein n=1 Tax=Perkinsus olseni TaxID=32597 RepID=A0A7J6PNE5_PEROL|nr:hypothetical protein FOZ60_007513 [Perkinsus olseni]